MKFLADYIREDLLINGDTGDALRETCTALCADPKLALKPVVCWTSKGWVRFPAPNADAPWHSDPKEFSRDQWTALMCYIILTKYPVLYSTWRFQRLFKAQNGDIVSWEYVMYLRAFRLWYTYPVMMILDLGLLINVMIRVVKSYIDQNDTADDINITTMVVVFSKVYPTPVTFLSRMLYKLYKGGVFGAWHRYYQRPEAPPMDELWKPLINKYIGVK